MSFKVTKMGDDYWIDGKEWKKLKRYLKELGVMLGAIERKE